MLTAHHSKEPHTIPKTVVSLGWAMMCACLSYVMTLGVFALYLKSIGHSQTSIGFLEGLFEAISFFVKLCSGVISDMLRNRKGMILLGYAFLVVSPPTVALSTSALGACVGRALNRIGNGIYSVPRDALVGDVAPKHMRGQCFGLNRSMGTIGSIMGGVIAFGAMHYFNCGFKAIFALAGISVLIGLLIIIFSVKDSYAEPAPSTTPLMPQQKFKLSDLRELGWDYALVMCVAVVFWLSRIEEAFMPLYANLHFNLSLSYIPLIMTVYNVTYTLSSYPIGILADRTNRVVFLGIGIVILILADLSFFAATTMTEFWVGVILWGIQMGIAMNTFTTLIVDITPKKLHGTAFGCYYIICAICVIISNSSAGFISETWGNRYAYLVSAFIASLSLIILVLVMKYRKISATH